MIYALLTELALVTKSIIVDVAPIVAVLLGFQLGVLRKSIPKFRQVALGLVYVVVGLAFFLFGLEKALFPLGKEMARMLTDPSFVGSEENGVLQWHDYYWTYIFAFAIGFATTIAEPSLIAVAIKANEVSGGAVKARGLRLAVALGVAISLSVGTYRIVTGSPLYVFMVVGYAVVVVQTMLAPKFIIPLAYDSGGVTTSTVTVPIVTALGLGLASSVPGRSPLLDGFGLIALASLFPIITVLGYAQLSEWIIRREKLKKHSRTHLEGDNP